MRVVIAEDQALLREGIVALLREYDIDVVAQAEDGPGLLRIVDGHKPDLAIVDVRLPPTFTDEGVRAAIEARERASRPRHPDPVPVRRAGLHGRAAGDRRGRDRLPAQGARRRGPRRSSTPCERVAAGGTALDREVVAELVGARGPSGARGAARVAHPARARGARADGRGPHERRDRARARRHARRRREAHLEHLRQARPPRHRRRPPPRARRARLPAGGATADAAPAMQERRATITEPARETPVVHRADVLVVGSGPGGLAAALAAARAGADVALVERFGCFGGNLTVVGVEGLAWYRHEADRRGGRDRARVRGAREGDGRGRARGAVALLRDRLRGLQGGRRPPRRGGGRAPDAPPDRSSRR